MSKVTNIYEGIYKKYGVYELFNCLIEKYHISFMNLDMKNVLVQFSNQDIIIYEESSQCRFVIHPEEEYVLFTKEYLDYREIFYMDLNGGVFKQSAIFEIRDGKVLVVDGLNDEDIQNLRIIRTTCDDEFFLNGDFERTLSFYGDEIQEDYSYIGESKDSNVSFKKIILPDEGMYVRLTTSYKQVYLSESITTQIEVVASKKTPTVKFQGRVRDKNGILGNSIKEDRANVMLCFNSISDKKINSEGVVLYKKDGCLNIRIFKSINGRLIEGKESYKTGFKGDSLSLLDIDVLIDFLSKDLFFDHINIIVQELLRLKEILFVQEKESSKVIDFLDSRIRKFGYFQGLMQDVKNNLGWYENMIEEKVNCSVKGVNNKSKRYLKNQI